MKNIYLFVIVFLLFLPILSAKDIDPKSLPKLLGTNNAGKEFYFTFLPAWETPVAGNDLKIYISSTVRTKVTIEVPGKGYTKVKYTKPNDIIEYTLAPSIGQCYRKTDREKPDSDQVYTNFGVHVISDDPIICQAVARYAYISDGYVVLPVNSLGTEYIVSTFPDQSDNKTQWFPSLTGITAPYNNTEVKFILGGNDSTKTTGKLNPGDTSIYILNANDVLLFGSIGAGADLSGSKVLSSNPISVVSGNFTFYYKINDSHGLHNEMQIPTYSWGKVYHVIPIYERINNSIIKVFAKEADTKVFKDGSLLGILKNSGGIEGIGYLSMRADEGKLKPIVISGNKPINVTQYNPGPTDDSVKNDPFQMTLLPSELYQKEIIFHTPGVRGGYGFPRNYVNICYESDINDSLPDDFEIGLFEPSDSSFAWHKIKDTLWTGICKPFTKAEDGRQYYYLTLKLLYDGVYKLRYSKPFQAYLYGFSDYDSYGMPASVYLDSLNYSDVPTIDDFPLFDIYPNPASDKITIKTFIGSEYDSHILIYDLIGKVIYDETCQLSIGENKKIDIRGFAYGIYFVRIVTGKETDTKMFSVIK